MRVNNTKVIWNTCLELRDDRTARGREIRKVRNAWASGLGSTILRCETTAFVAAYGSLKRCRKETVLN